MVILLCAVRVKSNVWNGQESGLAAFERTSANSRHSSRHEKFGSRPEKQARTATKCTVVNGREYEFPRTATARPATAPYKGNWSTPTAIPIRPIDPSSLVSSIEKGNSTLAAM